MDLYGQTSKSLPQKFIIQAIEIILIGVSWWILFGQGGAWCESHLNIQNELGGENRRIIVLTFSIIIFVRIGYLMFFMLKRRIPWEEAVGVPIAFGLYYVGFSLFVLPSSSPLGPLAYLAVALFVIGCVLNTGGEMLRYHWKKNPENAGKIYTQGFFKYSRHINYFGDILWVSAYAIITDNWYAILIPLLLFSLFAFYNAPKLDRYLKSKYGSDYDEYAQRTKMLIPFIY